MFSDTEILEKAKSLAKQAKLNTSTLSPFIQNLQFTSGCYSNEKNTILLETDEQFLSTLHKDDVLCIRGHRDDPAVLCATHSCHTLRQADVSNTMLLTCDLWLPAEDQHTAAVTAVSRAAASMEECRVRTVAVQTQLSSYIQMTECQPRVWRVIRLLHEARYTGRRGGSVAGRGYTYSCLLQQAQCSEQQMRAILCDKFLHTVTIDDRIHAVDMDCAYHVLTLLLQLADENCWSLDEMRRSEALTSLASLESEAVLESCLNHFFQRSHTDEDIYAAKEDVICRHYALVILQGGNRFNLAEFLRTWQQAVPAGMQAQLSQLCGACVCDHGTSPATIQALQLHELEEHSEARFQQLFAIKSHWTQEELLPYIRDLVPPRMSLDSYLARHSRCSGASDSRKLYSCRQFY